MNKRANHLDGDGSDPDRERPTGQRSRRRRRLACTAIALAAVVGMVGPAGDAAGAMTAPPVHLTDGRPLSAAAPSSPMVVNVHNAGDATVSAARAVAAHPSMIELDVSWDGEDLVVAHNLLPGPLKQDAVALTEGGWARSAGPGAVLVDVKTHSAKGLAALVTFLHSHQDRPVYLSTPDAGALRTLHAGAPWARQMLSLTSAAQRDRFLAGGVPVPGLVGVSAKQTLLSRPVVAELTHRGLLVLAYSVNDMARVDTLASWGVRGVTTDNLAIVRALSGSGPAIGRLV